jgi:hypothetical protein
MRRLVWLTALVLALAAPAVAFAVVGSGQDDGTLSVKAGVGKVYLNFNGSAVGRVQRGSIRVTDPVASDGLGFDFSGCDVERDRSDTTTNKNDTIKICKGDNIRFRAIGGRYQIAIGGMTSFSPGKGIYLSAVGQGSTSLNGAGDDPSLNVPSDGTYSLNDGPYKSLPNDPTTFPLAAPSGQ